MHYKTILALFALASVATAAPAEDFEKRQSGGQCQHQYCCADKFTTFFGKTFFTGCAGK
jgi:hypothetical protein